MVTEVKARRPQLVLGWVTSREDRRCEPESVHRCGLKSVNDHLYISTHLSNIISTLMTLNSSFLFLPLISRKTLLNLKQLLTLYLPGCQPICFRSISLKLNSYSLGFLNSLLKSLIQIFLCLLMSPILLLTQHANLVSFLTYHLLCLIIFPLYLNLAFSRFMTCVESETLST